MNGWRENVECDDAIRFQRGGWKRKMGTGKDGKSEESSKEEDGDVKKKAK